MNIKDIKKIEEEIKRFQSVLKDAKCKLEEYHEITKQRREWYAKRDNTKPQKALLEHEDISSTKVSAALKSTYKSMKYQIDKII